MYGNLETREASHPARLFKAKCHGGQWRVIEYRSDDSQPSPEIVLPARLYAEIVAARLNDTWRAALQHARTRGQPQRGAGNGRQRQHQASR